ncbi:MAG: transglycosylase domain-containing protein [Thiohalocapsa sp.]
MERKLAAILAADVVGYSRLMGLDEEGTLEQLKEHRRVLFDPKIIEHRGRIVKTTGDGLLVEFASVVDAVRCAVEVQRGMAERNIDVDPERRLDFRIGINVGDVIIDGDDIYGDGVNVAARLEGLAEPGGIYVSRVVRDQVRDKLDFGFEDMGAQSVKNIARPVRVHRVQITGLAPERGAKPARDRSASPTSRLALPRRLYRAPLRIARALVLVAIVVIVACRWVNPPVTPTMLLRLPTAGKMEQRTVSLAAISPELPQALIAAEDHHFCLHKGVDWDAAPNPAAGGSGGLQNVNSITMQLAGSLLLWPGDGSLRRTLEIPLAYAIDIVWPKRRIVEVYLNIAEWGNGVYGAEAAAEVMFHKNAAHLTRNEAALMVAALQDPLQTSGARALSERAVWATRKLDQRQENYSCLR